MAPHVQLARLRKPANKAVLARLLAPRVPKATFVPLFPPTRPGSFPLGDGKPTITGDTAWQVTDRPRRHGVTTFIGYPPKQGTLPIMLDGFIEDRNVEPDFQYIWKLQLLPVVPRLPSLFGGSSEPWIGPHPTVFRIEGPVLLSNRRWVLETIDIVDHITNDNGHVVRLALLLNLLEFVDVDLLIEASPAKSAVDRNRVGSVVGGGLFGSTGSVGSAIGGAVGGGVGSVLAGGL